MDSVREVIGTGFGGLAMDGQDDIDGAALTERVRQALAPVLPYGPSLIPLDILVVIATSEHAGAPVTMKQLLAVLPYSATGIRYNLAQLIADGWVTKDATADDRRLVHLLPAARVEAAFAEVRAELLRGLDSDSMH